MNRLSSLSIVIPAYNEARRLPPTIDRILSFYHAGNIPLKEILVVDDGSTDKTREVVEAFRLSSPLVHLLANPGNRGKGYSVRNGMLRATAEWILFSDADLSTPIEEYSKLMSAAHNHGAEIAIGSRALDRSLVEKRQGWARDMGGRIFNAVLRLAVGLDFADTQCGFKLFRADAARAIFSRQLLDGFSFDVEALAIARHLGYSTVEVPVRWRNEEDSRVTLASGLSSFADLNTIRANLRQHKYDKERTAPSSFNPAGKSS